LFPAQTRYEQRGGGTETSTERRVYFSPEIPGRRIGEARAEWEIFMQLAERVRPDAAKFIHFDDGAAIRKEIATAIPTYEGIQNLREKGDVFQYGGPRLCEGGLFPTPDGKARFSVVRPPDLDIPEGQFVLSTRRGKQFNSMIQGEIDPLLGAVRRDILLSEEDAAALHLQEGDPIEISNDLGSYQGTVRLAPIRPRNVQIYWPEGNVLIRRGVLDPACEMPDYNALVRIEYCTDAGVPQEYNVVSVVLRPTVKFDADHLSRHFYMTSSCGVCGKTALEAVRVAVRHRVREDRPSVDPATIASVPEQLRQGQAWFAETGGLHAAGLFDPGGKLLALREDVGRHNAVDKVVGEAFLGGRVPLAEDILAVSGRASLRACRRPGSAQARSGTRQGPPAASPA